MPQRAAFCLTSSCRRAPSGPDSANPPVMTMAARTFRSPSWRIAPGTEAAGMMTTARSVPDGISSADLTDGTPRIVSPLGLTGMTWPPKPASRMFLKIVNPSFPGFAEAPMTARRLGRKSAWRELLMSLLEIVLDEVYPRQVARAAKLLVRAQRRKSRGCEVLPRPPVETRDPTGLREADRGENALRSRARPDHHR